MTRIKLFQLDEATKETLTDGELLDLYPSVTFSTGVRVPVLVAIGQLDSIFCNLLYCQLLNTEALEHLLYPLAPSFELVRLPNTGHNLNLQQNAPTWFAAARDWMDRHYGPGNPPG